MKFIYCIKALRLFSLPLSLASIICGALIANSFGHFSWLIFALALLTAASLHLTCNIANDVGDYLSGNDSIVSKGGGTMLLSGKLKLRDFVIMACVFSVCSIVFGLSLIYVSLGNLFSTPSLVMISIGALALLAAIFYTIGKKPYGYRALGDLAVFLFFGVTAVAGTFFLLTQTFDWRVLLPAAAMGFLITGVVNLNNIRDIENDRKNRVTIPILMGERNAKHYQTFLTVGAFVCIALYLLFMRKIDFSIAYYVALIAPTSSFLFMVYYNKGLALNKAMGVLIGITILFVLGLW